MQISKSSVILIAFTIELRLNLNVRLLLLFGADVRTYCPFYIAFYVHILSVIEDML